MPKNNLSAKIKQHLAFRVVYGGIVNALVTDVAVKFSAEQEFKKYTAIWDTGATNTVISPRIVKDLQLKPIDVTKVYVVDSEEPKIVDVYFVDIGLPNKVHIPQLRVTCSAVKNCDVLIGMDIIQHGDFNISKQFDGKNYATMFSYCIPSHSNPVDLLEKSDAVNLRNHKKHITT